MLHLSVYPSNLYCITALLTNNVSFFAQCLSLGVNMELSPLSDSTLFCVSQMVNPIQIEHVCLSLHSLTLVKTYEAKLAEF